MHVSLNPFYSPVLIWCLYVSPPPGHRWSYCWSMALAPTEICQHGGKKVQWKHGKAQNVRQICVTKHLHNITICKYLKKSCWNKCCMYFTSIPSISYSSCSDLRVSWMKSCWSFSLQKFIQNCSKLRSKATVIIHIKHQSIKISI